MEAIGGATGIESFKNENWLATLREVDSNDIPQAFRDERLSELLDTGDVTVYEMTAPWGILWHLIVSKDGDILWAIPTGE